MKNSLKLIILTGLMTACLEQNALSAEHYESYASKGPAQPSYSQEKVEKLLHDVLSQNFLSPQQAEQALGKLPDSIKSDLKIFVSPTTVRIIPDRLESQEKVFMQTIERVLNNAEYNLMMLPEVVSKYYKTEGHKIVPK